MVWLTNKGVASLCTSTGDKIHYNFKLHSVARVSPTPFGEGTSSVLTAAAFYFSAVFSMNQNGFPVLGAGLLTRPVIVKDQLFIVTNDLRLWCLDPKDGKEVWVTDEIRQVLSISPTKVYALDKLNRLITIEPKSGAVLSVLPMDSYAFPVTNLHTDQIFLVGRDGTIQEIHETAAKNRTNYYVIEDQIVKPRSTIKVNDAEKPKEPASKAAPMEDNSDPFGNVVGDKKEEKKEQKKEEAPATDNPFK